MTFLYTATAKFDAVNDEKKLSWAKYIQSAKLTHLTELVSLDGILNEQLVEPDYDNEDDWKFVHISGNQLTGFFTTIEYVLRRVKLHRKFNMLAVVINPEEDCKVISIDGYEFLGYDLLDAAFSNSALTNCGGFDETFLPEELNDKGLIDDFDKAYEISTRLVQNNPEHPHACTNVIAVWRHKTNGI